MTAIKSIVVVGSSPKNWEDAVEQVVRKVSESVREITAVDVLQLSTRVESGRIVAYRATVQVTFPKDAADGPAESDAAGSSLQ